MSGKREQNRTQNRLSLIEATLETIAEVGIAETSVSAIVQRADLSRGMIHLHFGGKDNLVDAAARHSSQEYYQRLETSLQNAGDSGQERIEVMVRADLDEEVLNRKYVTLWSAFRGEANNRPAFAEYADTRDARLSNLIQHAFGQIVDEADLPEGQEVARDATLGVLALMEGMWADYLLHPDRFDRDEAARVVFRFLAGLFPAHFSSQGALS